MSRGDNEDPTDWSWTSEYKQEHAEAHAPEDRADDPSRRWKSPLDWAGRPTSAYERAELGKLQEQPRGGVWDWGRAFRENNAYLSARGLAPETSATRWAKHSKTDRQGRPLAADETPSDNFIPRQGRHEKPPF